MMTTQHDRPSVPKETMEPSIDHLRSYCEALERAVRGATQHSEAHVDLPSLRGLTSWTPRNIERYFALCIRDVANVCDTTTGDARARLLQHFAPLLDNAQWEAISSIHTFRSGLGDSAPATYLNRCIPMNQEFAVSTPGAASFAKFGSVGRSSLSQIFPLGESKALQTLCNGWHTRLEDENGTECFAAFRTGSFVHHGEKNAEERRNFGMRSALELLTGIAAEALGRLGKEKIGDILDKRAPLPLRIVSIDLQSTQVDEGLGLAIENWSSPEHRAILVELEKVRSLSMEMPMGARTTIIDILVDVKIFPFNLPVHSQNFESGRGWGDSVEHLNRSSFQRLLVSAAADNSSRVSENDRLSQQISPELQALFAEYQPGRLLFDPYRFASRVANFAYLTGHTVHFNCRSGKDRTGMLDAEAKMIAIALRQNDMPSYSEQLPQRHSDLLCDIALRGGSAEIQRLNTGVAGSKLRPYISDEKSDPLVTRIGVHRWSEFVGLSRITEI